MRKPERSDLLMAASLGLVGFLAACEAGATSSVGPPVDESAPIEIWLEETASRSGVDFRHRSGHESRYYMPESVSGGAGFFDADGDGDLDIYLLQSGSLVDPAKRLPGNQLYENLGDGTFRNITHGSGAEDDGYGMGLACGDYDNDGDTDLYVTNEGPDTLLRNDGSGRFEDVTAAAGLGQDGWGASTGFFDYDRDGDLDLFVVNYVDWSVETAIVCRGRMGEDFCSPGWYGAPDRDVLYRNNGDGTFTDVTESSGIGSDYGNGLAVLFGDFDSDGWPDIFVANDATPDILWINRHDGTFVNNASIAGCALGETGSATASMGVTAGDLDDDGDPDLMVCNFAHEEDSLFINDGGQFTHATTRAGLGSVSPHFTRFGMGWADLDNDGRLDLYQAAGRILRGRSSHGDNPYAEPNLLFRGLPGPRFREIRPRGGTRELLVAASRAAAFGDFDNDGGVDILVANMDDPPYLLRNVVPDRGGWITFRVIDEHGRDAEGATLSVRAGGKTITRDVRTAYSYLACNDPRVHVGLGSVARVDEVTVLWVDGATERFGPFDAGRIVTLRRGEGGARHSASR